MYFLDETYTQTHSVSFHIHFNAPMQRIDKDSIAQFVYK